MSKKNDFNIEIKGIKSVASVLNSQTPKDAINISKAAFNAMATTARNYCKEILKGHKDSGTLYKAVKSKRLKSDPLHPQSAVIITKGKNSPQNAWYWHFLEHGTKTTPALHFVRTAKQRIEQEKTQIVEASYKKVIIKRIKKNLKAARSKK